MNSSFSTWLDNELRSRGWSQSEAARRGEMSSQMVNAVVNGQANPGLDFCKGISRALKMPLEDVFRLAGILPPKPPGGGFRPRRIVHQGNTADRLVELWGLLAPEDQQRVLDLAERLAPLPEPRIIGDAPDEEP